MLIRTDEKKYGCEILNTTFSTRNEHENKLTHDMDIRKFRCSDCQQSFSRKSILKRHNVNSHRGEELSVRSLS